MSGELPPEKANQSVPPVTEYISQIVDRIVKHFNPEKVILFGSRARGDASADSDVDILVVMRYEGSAREVRLAMRKLLADIPIAKDVFVTTPEEFAWRHEIVGTLEHPAAEEGKVLYARSGEGDPGGQRMGD